MLIISTLIFFVFYVYVGYPFILWILTKNIKNVSPTNLYRGDISIVMVVCNEATSIAKKVENLYSLSFESGDKKIFIVDDASTDETASIIRTQYPDVHLIQSKERLGKANGLNLAMSKVDTELVTLVDCRQEIEINSLVHMASWFVESPNMGAVSGELILRTENGNDFSAGMDGYWHYEKFIRKSEAKLNSVPGVTGALYMLRVSTFRPLPIDTLLDDVQIPMMCCEQGYRVGYDERAIAWDVPSTSIDREKIRKIRTLSGNYQLLHRFPRWILPGGHPIWWQFFSHKIARLLAPYAAIMTLFIALIEGIQGNKLLLCYAVIFMLGLSLQPLSKIFPVMNRVSVIKLTSSFITLNWFCILASFHYFSGIKSGSWKN